MSLSYRKQSIDFPFHWFLYDVESLHSIVYFNQETHLAFEKMIDIIIENHLQVEKTLKSISKKN